MTKRRRGRGLRQGWNLGQKKKVARRALGSRRVFRALPPPICSEGQ